MTRAAVALALARIMAVGAASAPVTRAVLSTARASTASLAKGSPSAGTCLDVLDTILGSWPSAPSNEASITIGPAVNTSYLGCVNQRTWGHAGWTPTRLNSTGFRVRLTDMSSVSSKDLQLDYIGVRVGYTP